MDIMENTDLENGVTPTFSTSTLKMATLLCIQCMHLHGPPPNLCSSYFKVKLNFLNALA